MGIIENITTIVGNVLILVLEITLVVAIVVVIGNAAIQVILDFDSDNFIKKIRKLTTRLRR